MSIGEQSDLLDHRRSSDRLSEKIELWYRPTMSKDLYGRNRTAGLLCQGLTEAFQGAFELDRAE